MIHLFKLGPTSSSGAPQYAYVGLAEGGKPRIHLAAGDPEGIAAILAESPGQEISCEPGLEAAAGALGLPVAPLPTAIQKERAGLAWELASGVDHDKAKPDAIAALLRAAASFWAARAWELVGPEDRLHALFTEGRAHVEGEVSVQGGDGMAHPGLLLCDEEVPRKKLAHLSGAKWVEELRRGVGLTLELDRDPGWAAEILGEVYALPRVPIPSRKRHGKTSGVATQDLLMAAGLLESLAVHANAGGEGAEGRATVTAAGLSLHVLLGATAPQPAASRAALEGLTPAHAGPEAEEAPAQAPRATEELRPVPAEPPASGPESPPAAATEQRAERPAEVPETRKPAAGPAPEVEPPAAPISVVDPGTAPPTTAPPEPVLTPRRPEPQLTPARPAPAPPPPPATPPPAAPAREGWIARALRAFRRGEEPPGSEAEAPRSPAAPPRPAAPPSAAVEEPAPPSPAQEPDHAFAPFARALRVEIAREPAPLGAEEEEAATRLAAKLAERVAASAELVAFPAVALQIVEKVRDPKADATGVAGFISRDPALAADVVRVANSAAFRGVSEVESVRDGVARLGLEEVGRVASAVAARKLLDAPGADAGRRSALFLRAVAVATAAAGAALRQRGARSDHVWLGGLLHDVGRALSMQALRQLGAEGVEQLTSIHLAERVLDRIHVEVGAAAAKRWALPEWLQAICARHHDEAPQPGEVDLHLVRLTSALALLGEPLLGARAAREAAQSAAALGLGVPAVRALAADLRAAEQRAVALVR